MEVDDSSTIVKTKPVSFNFYHLAVIVSLTSSSDKLVNNRPFHKLRHKYREPRFRIIAMTIDSQRSDLKVFPIDKSMN